jgi:nucleoside-triphosphatase
MSGQQNLHKMGGHKILLTGLPGCGKTTLIKRVVDRLSFDIYGFFTRELKDKGKRVGFGIELFSAPHKRGVLSHVNIRSKYRVGKYGVDVDAFERLAIPELSVGIKQDSLIVIDEIGKMELFSVRFKDIIEKIFNRDIDILATIYYKRHPFCDKLKNYTGVDLITVNKDNRDELVERIVQVLSNHLA